ncbi:MAG: EscU/YscU/HrcU family type III secretion system export apparatus switch protein [Candidatus Eremiobacteraeota bacterium]|nr:EscU/YscU/HrcU family type III secretion system export apparatus switch protein [Candidatus Eremiobacteraeota bacterium]
MAETPDGEKQFEATASRLERAKREGNVARASELLGVTAFFCAALALCGVVGPIGSAAGSVLVSLSAQPSQSQLGKTTALVPLMIMGALMLVPAAAAACGAVAISLVQNGGLRVTHLTLNLSKLHPADGLKRMISHETLVSGLRAVVAFAAGVCAILPALRAIFLDGVGAANAAGLASVAWNNALHVILAVCGVGILFGGSDFAFALSRWKKKLRMSFDELKRDRKEHDGDPMTRGRRRAMHRSFTTGSLLKVKDAAFVITNPTHIAMALQYDPPQIAVPRVLVRSADEAAMRVRKLAQAHAIPIVQNVELARNLYAACDAGHLIPRETYIAVAQIVAALAAAGAIE